MTFSPTLATWAGIHALRGPSRTALVDGDTGRETTFGEFDRRTTAVARALGNLGVGAGDRVGLLTLNSPQMLEIFFAIAKVGAISVPINTRLVAPEASYILGDSRARLLFASRSLLHVANEAVKHTGVERIITVATAEDRLADRASDYDALTTMQSQGPMEGGAALDDVAMIMYTSGTTGKPKGAMLTHSNLLWNAIQYNGAGDGISRNDVNLAVAPLFHIGALGVNTMPLLYWGGTNVVTERFDPQQWGKLVEKYRVTMAFAVPTMWSVIVRSDVATTYDLSSIRVAKSGGAPCPLVVMEALRKHGVEFSEGFGMTETSPVASSMSPEDAAVHPGSIGLPIMHMDFRLVDSAGEDVLVGQVGELIMRGPQVFAGYWNDPEATSAAFREGWFLSGDLARVDEDGFYTLVDRKKDMIITGGGKAPRLGEVHHQVCSGSPY